jgi:hypothetical protein
MFLFGPLQVQIGSKDMVVNERMDFREALKGGILLDTVTAPNFL